MLAALALSLLAATSYAADVCNGDASLCERRYSNVTYIGTHDSYAIGEGIFDNQHKDVTSQLNDGVRALQVQAHDANGTIHLCHSSCMAKDAGSLEEYLKEVAAWITTNPNEVLSLVIVNINNLPASTYASVYSSVGLDKKSYAPSSPTLGVSEWPTLGAMIDAGTTLVTFMDNQADFATVPYLLAEWGNMYEDKYNVVDQEWSCSVNRSSGATNSQMYMINHFLDTAPIGGILMPDKNKLNETNAATGAGSIGFHVDNCLGLYGRAPNIILLDFYDSNGNAPFKAAAAMNGLSTDNVKAVEIYKASGTSGTVDPNSTADTQVSTKPLNGAGRAGVAIVGTLVAAAVALVV